MIRRHMMALRFGLMLADGGQYVIHPIPEYWLQGRSVADANGNGGGGPLATARLEALQTALEIFGACKRILERRFAASGEKTITSSRESFSMPASGT